MNSSTRTLQSGATAFLARPLILLALTTGCLLFWMPAPLPAQETADRFPRAEWLHSLNSIGGPADERVRVGDLLGDPTTARYLLRATSDLTPPLSSAGEFRWSLLAPELRIVRNSALPYSLNQGHLWAGRGNNYSLTLGARAMAGRFSATLAPTLVASKNLDFATLPPVLDRRQPGMSRFSSTWHRGQATIDTPWRFGNRSFRRVGLGESVVQADLGVVAVGLSNEHQWWGPGIQNALLMSNNAPGFPHLFLRSGDPWVTPLGEMEGRLISGLLSESLYFDADAGNDLRSISGLVVTLRPPFEPNLTLGAARTVFGPADRLLDAIAHSPHVFTRWENRGSVSDESFEPEYEQLLSLFGRWVLPEDGFESYFEWSRHELPVSFRDLAVSPHHTQGYTVGFQWVRPVRSALIRLHAEGSQLEFSSTFKQRRMDSYYTSRSVPQGYTHRGRVIGAAIGPGSSSQRLEIETMSPSFRLGFFGGRIRWETDALFSEAFPAGMQRGLHSNDTSILGGVRAGARIGPFEVTARHTSARRFNYMFQNPNTAYGGEGAIDVDNHTFELSVGLAAGPLRPSARARPAGDLEASQ